jgi:hypothetical protein
MKKIFLSFISSLFFFMGSNAFARNDRGSAAQPAQAQSYESYVIAQRLAQQRDTQMKQQATQFCLNRYPKAGVDRLKACAHQQYSALQGGKKVTAADGIVGRLKFNASTFKKLNPKVYVPLSQEVGSRQETRSMQVASCPQGRNPATGSCLNGEQATVTDKGTSRATYQTVGGVNTGQRVD